LRIVGAEFLEHAPIARLPAVDRDDPEEMPVLPAHHLHANTNGHDALPSMLTGSGADYSRKKCSRRKSAFSFLLVVRSLRDRPCRTGHAVTGPPAFSSPWAELRNPAKSRKNRPARRLARTGPPPPTRPRQRKEPGCGRGDNRRRLRPRRWALGNARP